MPVATRSRRSVGTDSPSKQTRSSEDSPVSFSHGSESPLETDGEHTHPSVSIANPADEKHSISYFLEQPHTVSFLLVGIAALIYFAFFRPHASSQDNIRMGIGAMIVTFLLYSALHVRSLEQMMQRPHLVFWRITLAAGVCYLLFMIFALCQTVDDSRFLLTYLFPSLGKKLPDRDYATDCRLFTPDHPSGRSMYNLHEAVHDEFIFAHLIGYFFKALLWRDWKLVWVTSLLFEVTEVTFQHWMENFKECWWDHFILDVFGCNLLGAWLGMMAVRYFQMREYNWIGESEEDDSSKPSRGYLSRIGSFFSPKKLRAYDWAILSSAKRFLYVLFIVAIVNGVEFYSFVLKYVLWIPPTNVMNTLRLFLWAGIGAPALREFYQFMTDKNTKRIGVNSWVSIALFFVETLVIAKYSNGIFVAPFPPNVKYPWMVVIALALIWFVWYFSRKNLHQHWETLVLRSIVSVMVILVCFIFFSAAPDLEWGKAWFNSFFETHSTQ